VPNVQTLVSHSFEYNRFIAVPIAKIVLPSQITILPLIMHAIQRAKHTGKSTRLINGELFAIILISGFTQVVFSELSTHCSTKSTHALHGRGLARSAIVILGICTHTPSASIRRAAVIFWRKDNPNNPATSIFEQNTHPVHKPSPK
jgi:hypothetical protein